MKKSKSILLIIAGICALVLVVILLMHAILPGVLSSKIESEISAGLNAGSVELYQVEAGSSSFSAFFKTTSVSEIRVIPNDTVLGGADLSVLPNQIFEAEVYNLNMSSWALITLAMGWKNVKVNRFYSDSVFFVIYTNESGLKKTDTAQPMKMEHIHLNDLSINKLSIEKRTVSDTSRQVLQTGKIGFSGVISFYDKEQDYFLNPGITAHSLKVLDAGSFSSDGLYTFLVDSILFEGNMQTADLSGLSIIPRYGKQEFQKHVQFETDRFDARLDHIRISGFEQEKAMQDGSIVLSQIEINGGRLEAFRDKNTLFNEQQRPLLPASLIQNAPFGLFAGKILVNRMDIVYAEVTEGSDAAGAIPFKQLSATINNLTNLKDSLALDSIMAIRAEALIFGKAMLQAEFKYNLTNPYGAYEAHGELAALSFVDINPAVYPLAGVKINAGTHQSASFYFYGNDVRSVGELRMRYSGLEIELVPDGREVFKDLARFVGKKALYHQANPSGNEELRIGKIDFDRDNKRFVFNYWWKSYLSGIKDTVLRDLFSS
jgi:hypothetical protein